MKKILTDRHISQSAHIKYSDIRHESSSWMCTYSFTHVFIVDPEWCGYFHWIRDFSTYKYVSGRPDPTDRPTDRPTVMLFRSLYLSLKMPPQVDCMVTTSGIVYSEDKSNTTYAKRPMKAKLSLFYTDILMDYRAVNKLPEPTTASQMRREMLWFNLHV